MGPDVELLFIGAPERQVSASKPMIVVPDLYSAQVRIDGNTFRQLQVPTQDAVLGFSDGHYATLSGGGTAVLTKDRRSPGDGLALKAPADRVSDPAANFDDVELTWLTSNGPEAPEEIRDSYVDAFSYLEADPDLGRSGLWAPQLGAIHSVLGYWTTGAGDPATVVMPTGTGKTEAMIGLFVAGRIERVLVIVPSDALRTQIADKFERLGVLPKAGVIGAHARLPVVGRLRHGFSSLDNARQFVDGCNVIVTTPQALLSKRSDEARAAIVEGCSHLFVDEAHHVEAPKWRGIRDRFEGKPILQFTATPYREDGKPLAGKRLYRYPLSLAQKQGYFAEIDYTSVINLREPDRAIAEAAVARLRNDLENGFDHVLMARVSTIRRTAEVLKLYEALASDLGPRAIHSELKAPDRRAALDALDSRDTRIVVCVDMLGEGFDLPALKVAALHSPHKSLAVTLQFIGRFARVASDKKLGTASVFVGRPDLAPGHGLRPLFAEDADWNQLISDLSEDSSKAEEEASEFEEGFGSQPDEVTVRSLAPKMSTVVYRTACEDWNPTAILDLYPLETLLSQPLPVNPIARVAWFVVRSEEAVRWGHLAEVTETAYVLFVVYWSKDDNLLYINVSDTDTRLTKLADAVTGGKAELVRGDEVYRAFATVERTIPSMLGLLDVRDSDRRFTSFAGANVAAGLAEAEAATKEQTNVFGSGFENGERVSRGASKKGRVWESRAAQTLKQWVDWCDRIGPLLVDESIDPERVHKSFISPERLDVFPNLVPLAMEWPIEFVTSPSEALTLRQGAQEVPAIDADLRISGFAKGGPIRLEVVTDAWSSPYVANIEDKVLTYRPELEEVEIRRGLHGWMPLSEYLTFASTGPLIILEQDAVIVQPGYLLQPKQEAERQAYPRDKLIVPTWGKGLQIRRESQGRPKNPDSIQARAIAFVKELEDWDVVLDDDTSGEIADIVAIRMSGDEIHFMLVHCKFSSEDAPGARVEDLYEVCGQAQRSTVRRVHPAATFQNLIRRERNRQQRSGRDGFEVGNMSALYDLQDASERLRPRFTIAIAQPGLSKARAGRNQLELLAATELYVRQVAKAEFTVFCGE